MDILWYSYCLLWLTLLGLWDFIKKVIIARGYDKDVFLSVSYILYIFLFLWNFLITGDGNITQYEIIQWLPAWFFDFLISLWFLLALKYTDSSLVFVAVRLISSFVILAIWAWYFQDSLNIINILWFIIWIAAIFLLSGYEVWKKYRIEKKWLIGISMALIWIIWANSYFKYVVDVVDIPSFMFVKYAVITTLVFAYMTLRNKWWNFNKKSIIPVIPFALVSTGLFLTYFWYISPQIYSLGPLSISYKILSYSLAVPILLSVIFYWEKLTKKRILAFWLTALSLLFFFF